MPSVLDDHRSHRGHLGDLMPRRPGVPAQQQVPTLPTRRRLDVHDLVDLFGWHQRSTCAPMPTLATLLAHRPFPLAMHRRARRVGGRWLRGVARGLVRALFQRADPLRQRHHLLLQRQHQDPHRLRRLGPVERVNAGWGGGSSRLSSTRGDPLSTRLTPHVNGYDLELIELDIVVRWRGIHWRTSSVFQQRIAP